MDERPEVDIEGLTDLQPCTGGWEMFVPFDDGTTIRIHIPTRGLLTIARKALQTEAMEISIQTDWQPGVMTHIIETERVDP